ncbi:unnamed protein product [Chondrus crispus]|uniref:Secreted protein n=1 Tax=Chondrus crispus TaxID=2769 RepID=R7Q3F6_CHOCR|nr:unnamed protein product [Chondrus crispus]CDF33077.1 unnamed protein product [Chondrus crispus]|eukprot:XP_005712880.1 unnamed protein product [Chondrus crispus]
MTPRICRWSRAGTASFTPTGMSLLTMAVTAAPWASPCSRTATTRTPSHPQATPRCRMMSTVVSRSAPRITKSCPT